MDDIWKWLLGLIVTLAAAAFWKIWDRFGKQDDKMSATAKDLHARIDRTNERVQAVRDEHVRKDDFKEMRAEVREEMRIHGEKLDRLIQLQARPGRQRSGGQ